MLPTIAVAVAALAAVHLAALFYARQMLRHQMMIAELRVEIDMELAKHGLTQEQVLENIAELQRARVLLDDRVIYSLWRNGTFEIFQVRTPTTQQQESVCKFA